MRAVFGSSIAMSVIRSYPSRDAMAGLVVAASHVNRRSFAVIGAPSDQTASSRSRTRTEKGVPPTSEAAGSFASSHGVRSPFGPSRYSPGHSSRARSRVGGASPPVMKGFSVAGSCG
jgi:hypothetical protein